VFSCIADAVSGGRPCRRGIILRLQYDTVLVKSDCTVFCTVATDPTIASCTLGASFRRAIAKPLGRTLRLWLALCRWSAGEGSCLASHPELNLFRLPTRPSNFRNAGPHGRAYHVSKHVYSFSFIFLLGFYKCCSRKDGKRNFVKREIGFCCRRTTLTCYRVCACVRTSRKCDYLHEISEDVVGRI
jgi:hypothetical protein